MPQVNKQVQYSKVNTSDGDALRPSLRVVKVMSCPALFSAVKKIVLLAQVYLRVSERLSYMESTAFTRAAHDNPSILDIITFTSRILKINYDIIKGDGDNHEGILYHRNQFPTFR